MAVFSSTSPSKSILSVEKKQKSKARKEIASNDDSSIPASPTKPRNKCPGVRVIGGRIYDSENGKSCHQCRQKTRDFVASCKNMKKDKPCTISFCHKCLLNRYGEKAEDMAILDNWDCPKCRGICNCSLCMKKRGHKPTGILVHRAKATGFSSVSDMLHVGGPENVANETLVNDTVVSPKKSHTLTKEKVYVSPKKLGKENSFDGNIDSKIASQTLASDFDSKKPKKLKRKGLEETHESNSNGHIALKRVSPRKHLVSKETDSKTVITPKKVKREGLKLVQHSNTIDDMIPTNNFSQGVSQISNEIFKKKAKNDSKNDCSIIDKKVHKTKGNKKTALDPKKEEKKNNGTNCFAYKELGTLKSLETLNVEVNPKIVLESSKVNRGTVNLLQNIVDVDIPLPQGTDLAIVLGVEIQPEEIGNALQFLEFCSAFGKVLDIKKGVAGCVLQEVLHGPRGRRAQYSSNVQLHIQLLSVILTDRGEISHSLSPTHGKNSWLKALGEYISESNLFRELPSDCFDRGAEGYNELHSSKKLRLLNFICDEALGTEKLRNWIDDQNIKCAQKEKEAKEKVTAARLKEKSMKQKMHDEIAKAIVAKSGTSLSITEHQTIVAQIKLEASQAHSEMLEAMEMLPKKRKQCDSVRTEPVFVDVDGRVFWRLKCYKESEILLQELGILDEVATQEKWVVYDAEQKKGIEDYMSVRRKKKLRSQVVLNTVWSENSEAVL